MRRTNKAKEVLNILLLSGYGEDNPRKTLWRNSDAVLAMEKQSIEFGEWIEKNTYPAGGGKFYQYSTKGVKFKKAVTVRQLYKRFNNGK